MATEHNKQLDDTVKFMEVKMLDIDPFGYNAERFKKYEDEVDFRDAVPSNREFEVSLADEPSDALMVGSNTQDYHVIINVTICYEHYKIQKLNAKRDYAVIRDKFIFADTSELNALGFHYFWIPPEGNLFEINQENNMMYMIVPVTCRYTVTRVTT